MVPKLNFLKGAIHDCIDEVRGKGLSYGEIVGVLEFVKYGMFVEANNEH